MRARITAASTGRRRVPGRLAVALAAATILAGVVLVVLWAPAAAVPALLAAHAVGAVVLLVSALVRAVRGRQLSAGGAGGARALHALRRLSSYVHGAAATLVVSGVALTAAAPGTALESLGSAWLRAALLLLGASFALSAVLERRVEAQRAVMAALTADAPRSLGWERLAGRLCRLARVSCALVTATAIVLVTQRPV